MPTDKDTLARAAQLIEQVGIGVMTTVDPQHRPRSRWMAAVPEEGLVRLYALSAKATRKIEQLSQNPAVCWLFANTNYRDVVTLTGTARTLPTSEVSMSVWHQLTEATERYAAEEARDEGHYAFNVIVTQIDTVEFYSPGSELYVPRMVDLNATQS